MDPSKKFCLSESTADALGLSTTVKLKMSGAPTRRGTYLSKPLPSFPSRPQARIARRVALISSLLICAVATVHSPVPVSASGPSPQVRVPFPQDEGILTPYSFELGYPLVTLMYDTLLSRDRDGQPKPWLARSVERRAGGRNLVLSLRRGVRWQDGRPLTAADVAFTFGFVRRHLHLRFTPELREVLGVRAVNRYTVTIDLRQPAPGFLDQPLADLPILPRHLWANRSADRPIPPGLPIGSGPYRMTSYLPGKGYGFAANPAYFRGRPRVDRIRVDFMRGGRRTLDALERGRVDVVPTGLPVATGDRLENGSRLQVRPGVNYTGTALALNLRNAPFDRAAARRAVAQALDTGQIAGAVGLLPASEGFLHPDSAWAPDSALAAVEGPASRREMTRLGTPPIEVLAPDDDPVRLDVGRQVVGALRRAGAKAMLTEVSRRAFDRALGSDGSRPTFQAAVTGISPLASYDPDYLRTSFATGSLLNVTGYRSLAFDRLAERVARTSDRRARLRAVAAELRQLARDVPAVPLAFSQGAFAYRPSAYDGWVSVKGSGALDKRSFLAAGPASRAPEMTRSEGSPLGALGLASVGLLFVAIALFVVALRRRHAG